MQASFLFFLPLLMSLSGIQIQDRFDLIVEVRPATGTKLPAEAWVTLDGSDNGEHSTTLLSGRRTVRFPALPTGSYIVKVEAEGYQTSHVAFVARTSMGDEYVTVELGPPKSADKTTTGLPVIHYQALQLSSQAQAYWEQAGKALNENRFDSALKNLERISHLEPAFASAHSSRGTIYLELRQWNQAEEAFQKAVEVAPSDYRYHLGLGWFYLQTDRATEAITPLQRAVELKPEDAEAHAFLGEAMRLTGNIEDSTVQLQKALALVPNLGLALHALGTAYLELNKPEQALQCFLTLLETEELPDAELKRVKHLISELGKRLEAEEN